MAVNTVARVWNPYKELYFTVDGAVQRKQPDTIQDLEAALRKHKPDFISLLQNPAKNPTHREAVKKAHKDGLPIQGQQGTQIFDQGFIQETLTLSDLFDLNEYAAVELLSAGESQQPYFPGQPRGLVAVLLYYDGRVSLVNSLRTLIQAREGRCWSLGLHEDLQGVVNKFTEQVMAEGLVNKVLEQLRKCDATAAIERLQKPEFRALGTANHRKQVTNKIHEIQLSLAECLYCWACQTPLPKDAILRLLAYLREDGATGADGSLNDVTLCVLMALLYSFDIRALEQDNSDEMLLKFPITSDVSFVPEVHREILSTKKWSHTGLKCVIQFAWAVTLRSLSQYPVAQGLCEYIEQDENIIDLTFEDNVFQVLRNSILASESFHKEEYYVRIIHNIITDFIVQMPLKVKELRNRGDETARIILANQQEGLDSPAGLRRDFEHLMRMIGELYEKDPNRLELSLEFWCPQESAFSSRAGHSALFNGRSPQRQVGLYKFVRLAGDLLLPPLFIPYMHMLRGLAAGPQCSHHCFNLLRNNGAGGGQGNTVAWDHFFVSLNQYYANLRQEAPVTHDLAHIYRPHSRGITPQELEGLVAVLELTRTVAHWDETARIALCENQQWLPLVVLLGLVGCSVPARLKSELLSTLAALCRTPAVAASFWQSLEVSQIIPTIPATTVHRKGGLHIELDEIEARNEEFPMTLAFLDLMGVLTDSKIPPGLGAGYRAPGFQPYLDFLRNSVFLKFNTRAYKNPAEKWKVGAAVLEVLYKLLKDHVVKADDFLDQYVEVQGEGATVANKTPGHTLLVHMLNDSATLKMILYLIDEGAKMLDKHIPFPGKCDLERSVLLCLKMVEATLDKQDVFLDTLRDSGSAVLVSQIDNLLLGINPRSGKADHLANVAKYMTYSSWLPEHALTAVRVLSGVSKSSVVQPKLVSLFTASQDLAQRLLQGFVECLEYAEEPEEPQDAKDFTDEELAVGQIRNATRQQILKLLLLTLDQKSPNLAHFLLGFEIRKPVSKTNLQDPGVLDSARTCLHSVLSILNRDVETRSRPACVTETPRLAELAYHLIYLLCANRDTSGPSMRYLRTHDFLYRHLQHLPLQVTDDGGSAAVAESLLLSQQSWLLRTAAIELRLTSVNRQRSHTQRLLNLFLDDTPSFQQRPVQSEGIYDTDFSQYDLEYSMYNASTLQYHQAMAGNQTRRKILCMLDAILFGQELPPPLELEYFNPALIEQVVASCEQKNDLGLTLANVRNLHSILTNELNNSQRTGTGQRLHILQEIGAICANVVERNAYREAIHAKRQVFDSWRQVVETILTACPEDLLQGEPRQSVIFELLQDLLAKVSKEDAVPELTGPVAGVLLTLMANLRQCFLTDPSTDPGSDATTRYISVLDGPSVAGATSHMAMFSQSGGARTLFASSLQVVLRGLIEHLMRSSSGTQRVRAYLYGSLLYYLQIAQKPKSTHLEPGTDDVSVGSKLVRKEKEFERLIRENNDTISSYGENFMEVTCRDACDGHDVNKMLALASVDLILSMDKQSHWLAHMSAKGYLQHIIDSLRHDDDRLQAMLQPNPEPLKALYVFESKIGLLTRVGETALGAHTMLQCGIASRLADCAIFDCRPETDSGVEGFIPSVLSRYRHQILFPVLRLCLAILTSLGIENRQASQPILKFILVHADVFNAILRDRQLPGSQHSLESLQELALATAVVSRAAVDDGSDDFLSGDTATIELRSSLPRLQRQMLALLPKYCLTERLRKQLQAAGHAQRLAGGSGPEGGGGGPAGVWDPATPGGGLPRDTVTDTQLAVVEVAANVIAFCRSIVSKSGVSSQSFRIIFGPSLVEAMSRDLHGFEDLQSSLVSGSRPQNLGVVLHMLQQCTAQFLFTFESHKQHLRKYNHISDLTAEELKDFCGATSHEKLSSQQKQQLARQRLQQIVSSKAKEMELFSYIIENCLFILWRHLEFYLLHCVPSDGGDTLFRTHTKKQQQLRRLQDLPGSSDVPEMQDDLDLALSVGVSREELDQLKRDAPSCVSDTLLKRLQEIEQCWSRNRTRFGYMGALVRRLKRLMRLHTATS